MAGDVLGASKCRLADGAGVVSGHGVVGGSSGAAVEGRAVMGLGEWTLGFILVECSDMSRGTRRSIVAPVDR